MWWSTVFCCSGTLRSQSCWQAAAANCYVQNRSTLTNHKRTTLRGLNSSFGIIWVSGSPKIPNWFARKLLTPRTQSSSCIRFRMGVSLGFQQLHWWLGASRDLEYASWLVWSQFRFFFSCLLFGWRKLHYRHAPHTGDFSYCYLWTNDYYCNDKWIVSQLIYDQWKMSKNRWDVV